MTHKNSSSLSTHARRGRNLRILRLGIGNLESSAARKIILTVHLALLIFFWIFRADMAAALTPSEALSDMYTGLFSVAIPLYAALSTCIILVLFGITINTYPVYYAMQRAGIFDEAEEPPILTGIYRCEQYRNAFILEFMSVAIPRSVWEDKQAEIESALNVYIAKIEEGRDRQTILVYACSPEFAFDENLKWDDKYICHDTFFLVLGEGLLGTITINLAVIPHILIGGATGSGKTVLLKSLLYQCWKKDAQVIIADFKGGVDFPPVWRNKCTLIDNDVDFLAKLEEVIATLEQRKALLREAGAANIDDYNELTGLQMQRIIIACDEVAELSPKGITDKERKERFQAIESALSTIARQGRAFGIHLILATQRPDANILNGQIKNNMDCRICGRAGIVLSQIILDSADADKVIPKDSHRFMLYDGTVLQPYNFSDTEVMREKR